MQKFHIVNEQAVELQVSHKQLFQQKQELERDSEAILPK